MKRPARRSKQRDTRDGAVLDWSAMPEEVRQGIDALKDKKVEGIRVYDLRQFTPFCDFVILGTVFSSTQARVARHAVTESMESAGIRLYGLEGEDDSGWLLVDFWDMVVHLFRPETREFYNLEALWDDFPWWPGETEV